MLSLTSSAASPQKIGTTIVWSAAATGGLAPYSFQWSVYQAGTWAVGSWTPASSWSWTPTIAGADDQIRVAVRSSGSTSASGELAQTVPFTVTAPSISLVYLQKSKLPPQIVGTTVTWYAGASGGLAPYQYRWWVFDGSVWSALTAWTTSSTLSWTPSVANANYIVWVGARSAGSSVDAAEASKAVAFPITPAP
jgi:hypothetical protein